MCGRFTLTTDPKKVSEAFNGIEVPSEIPPRYNIAPSQPIAVVANNNPQRLEFFRWGLIPSWAKDPKIGNRMINARAETLAEKPSFKTAYKRRRCLIPADGFYEWRRSPVGKTKIPMYIKLHNDELFAFAGLWELWQGPDGSDILSCTIITTSPNELVAEIHNRMPVILPPESYGPWLDPAEQRPEELDALLKPFPAAQMMAHRVSTTVNNPRNDSPECITPVDSLL